MKCGIIYRAFNKISGKSYIGQTTEGLKKRIRLHYANSKFKKDGCFCNNYHFARAIRKYDKNDWEWIILCECTESNLDGAEKLFISLYNAFKNGYNSDYGGKSCRGYKHSEETKKKISRSNAGKVMPKEAVNKVSSILKELFKADNAPSAKLTWEKVNIIRNKYLFDLINIYKLSEEFNVAPSTINAIIKNKTWKSEEYAINLNKIEESKFKIKSLANSKEKNNASKLTIKKVQGIRQKYKTGKYSYRKLAKEYNVSHSNIRSIINNKTWKE